MGIEIMLGFEVDIKVGNVFLFINIFVGIVVYNIELKFGKGG